MKRLTEYRPTGFDSSIGSFFDSDDPRRNWIVCPVSITRDTGAFYQSNFDSCLKILGGESDTVEIHRFGHWGPGWFEVIIVDPSRMAEVQVIADRLSDYPILDEDHFSQLEYDQQWETWDKCYRSDLVSEVLKYVPEELEEWIEETPDRVWDEMFSEYLNQGNGGEWGSDSQGNSYLNSLDDLVQWIIKEMQD